MQGRSAVSEPHTVVKIIAPAADLADLIEIEHADTGEFEAPASAVEIPAVETLSDDRIPTTETVTQFPVHLGRQLHDARDDFSYIALADDRRQRLIDVNNVIRQTRHRHVWVDRLPRINKQTHFKNIARNDFVMSH